MKSTLLSTEFHLSFTQIQIRLYWKCDTTDYRWIMQQCFKFSVDLKGQLAYV
jgi:hypothetical protein